MKALFALLPVFLLMACCTPLETMTLDSAIATLTATAWTPTPILPSPTPQPVTGRFVEILNGNMLGADPLAETIDAKYQVLDVQFVMDPQTQAVTLMKVHVECECIAGQCCTTERSFIQFARAISANPRTLSRIQENVPTTVRDVCVVAFDRMSQTGAIQAQWQDILLYATGQINGNQLGARIVRLQP